MSIRTGKSAAVTDPGRKRRRNEDAFVCRPPLFAIADGVGGAQAGEIASRLAAAAAREDTAIDAPPEERVRALIKEANRRVYTRSSEDKSVSGMGTTMTVALVHADGVTIGHVGDSRAYLVRKGAVEQVTDDHSLVSELVRSGKLSPEEAETHPQRSVITRALGSEADVDVDVFTLAAEPEDFFLLCSDGLSDMVGDAEILALVEANRADPEAAAKALVGAANKAGGEDNITVVCFDIVAGAAPTGGDGQAAVDEQTLTEADAVPAIAEEAGWDEDGWGPPEERAPRRVPRLGKRSLTVLAAIVVLLAIAGALAVYGLSKAHFVGAEKDGHVAVYQGVPWNLIGHLHLYRSVYVSPLVAAQLSQKERRKLFNHDLTSEATARRKIHVYEEQITP